MNSAEVLADLATLRREIWQRLARVPGTPSDPWFYPIVATVDADRPQGRVVVLRAARERVRELEFHTDVRSPKVAQLRHRPKIDWIFYDPGARVQVRLQGHSRVHAADALARRRWRELPSLKQASYQRVLPPGTPTQSPKEALATTSKEVHFAVVITTVESLEWLWLAPVGHRRAGFRYAAKKWTCTWLAP